MLDITKTVCVGCNFQSKHDALLKAWQENPSNPQLTILRNKPPVWDAGRYIATNLVPLSFAVRAARA